MRHRSGHPDSRSDFNSATKTGIRDHTDLSSVTYSDRHRDSVAHSRTYGFQYPFADNHIHTDRPTNGDDDTNRRSDRDAQPDANDRTDRDTHTATATCAHRHTHANTDRDLDVNSYGRASPDTYT